MIDHSTTSKTIKTTVHKMKVPHAELLEILGIPEAMRNRIKMQYHVFGSPASHSATYQIISHGQLEIEWVEEEEIK